MATITQLPTIGNESTAMELDALYLDPDNLEVLHTVRDEMAREGGAWTAPTLKLTNALQLVETGGVTPHSEPDTYYVAGQDEPRYQATANGCTCPSSRQGPSKVCKHVTAVVLYTRWRTALARRDGQASLLAPPPTPEERLATLPLETAQEGTQQPDTATQESIPMVIDVRASETPLEAPVLRDEAFPPLGTSLMPEVSDLTPCYVARDKIERSDRIDQLMAALARAQSKIRNPIFDSQNPHFRAKYVSLAAVRDAVMPLLAAEGIAVTQLPDTRDGMAMVTTGLWHTSGQYLVSTTCLPLSKADEQGCGKAITYARRYALMGFINVAGDEDDDGESLRKSAGSTLSPLDTIRELVGARGEEATPRRVKELTSLDLAPGNYQAIITKLKEIAHV